MKRSFIVLLTVFFCAPSVGASILRSDSIDIKRTILYCDITDFVSKQLQGHANILIESKINGQNTVVFDLEGLSVDSVQWNGNTAIYSQSTADVQINAPSSFNQGDTAVLDIYYTGTPLQDATWGGFYYVGNYAFQMGVGFNAQPHSIGRYWHPCFDNFVERSPYEFYITTEPNKMGITNGNFLDSTILGNGNIQWHYKLNEEIPSYLAAVAVSDYVWVKKNLTGNAGITPAWIAAPAVDTNKVNGSFANLQSSFSMLEKNFGTHSFPKVGYTLVPFSAGAMEHATNIHIGTAFINGGLTYETLIAHELAHHWWGDLVTCRTAEDMWLNEGWASYAEQLHQEFTYGEAAYKEGVKSNHYSVLSRAHISDDGYRAISPMDSLHTYGATVYNKGSDAIHTLRTYLDDSLFFNGTTAFLNANKFQDISSEDLRDFLSNYTGINMNDYFKDWIFQPGFPHFSIDSTSITQNNSQYETSVFIRHRKHQSTNYYNNVPITVGFYDEQFNREVYKVNFDGRCTELKVNLDFEPKMIVLDPEEKISDAITENQFRVTAPTLKALTESQVRVWVKRVVNNNDSSLMHIAHHWVAPDREIDPSISGYVLNDKRYWTVSGINLANCKGKIQFIYDANASNNFLDSTWLQNSEDSIRLFYRKDASELWSFANDSLQTFSTLDNKGNVFTKEILAGEYCFGIKRANYTDPLQSDYAPGNCNVVTNTNDIQRKETEPFEIYPNPASGYLIISAKENFEGNLIVNAINGKVVMNQKVKLKPHLQRLALPDLPSGVYLINLGNKETRYRKTFVIKR